MKIGIDARFYHSRHAGISRYTKGLVHALFAIDKKNHYTVFLYPEAKDEWTIDQPNVVPVFTNIGHYSWREQVIFPSDLSKYKFDLVHFCNFNHPVLYPGKFVVTIHDLAYFIYEGERLKGKLIKPAFRVVMESAVRRARKVIAITDYTKREVVRRFRVPAKRVAVIHEGVDQKQFTKGRSNEVTKLKRKYDLEDPVILYVGQWRPHKNVPVLLEAFRVFRQSGRKVQLVLGGSPNPDVLAVIESHPFKDDIVVRGFIPDSELPVWYQSASVFVFPSLHEGFGLPVLEAQAVGVPVIASSATTLPEVGGKGALYFHPDRPRELAGHLSALLSNKDLRARMIRLGRENIRRFNWRDAAEKTLKLYEEIVHADFSR